MLRILGSLFGIISLILMLVAFVPLLGWLNWLVIPFAVIGLIISSLGNSTGGRAMNGVAIIVGIIRLVWGGGIL
jgi:hypothetical protein